MIYLKYLRINSILLLSLSLLSFSCQTSEKKQAKQIIHEWENKQVIFTDNLTCSFLGKDTIYDELFGKKYKSFRISAFFRQK